MPGNSIYRISCVPKFGTRKSEAHIFKGTLDDLVYKFGTKDSNPMLGFTYKRVLYIYKFYLWNGFDWVNIPDPRPTMFSS